MKIISKFLICTILVYGALASTIAIAEETAQPVVKIEIPATTDNNTNINYVDNNTSATSKAIEATKDATDKTIEATKKATKKTVEATKDVTDKTVKATKKLQKRQLKQLKM